MVVHGEIYMTPIIDYLTKNHMLKEKVEFHNLKRLVSQYVVMAGKLYKIRRSTPCWGVL